MSHTNLIKPTLTYKGFKNAVKDYDEYSVIEELAANSYDEDAKTVVILLNTLSMPFFLTWATVATIIIMYVKTYVITF